MTGRRASTGAAVSTLVAATLVTASPLTVADEGPRFAVELGASRTSGDFDLESRTTIDSLTARGSLLLPRFELHVSVPMLRIDGPGDVSIVGGRAVTGRTRLPGQVPDGVPGPGPGIDPGTGRPGVPTDPTTEPTDETELLAQRRESGLGDIVIRGEYHLLQGGAGRPWITTSVAVKTATGDEDRGLGTGGTDLEVGLSVAQPLGRVDLLADAGYTWVDSSDRFELRNTTRLGGGVSMPFGHDYRHSAYIYIDHRSSTVPGFDAQRAVTVGGGTWLDEDRRWRLSLSLGTGLSDSAEDYSAGVRIGHRF